jgi:hypothetical protein
MAERKAMIDREHDLPIVKQAEILKISRGSVYYLPQLPRIIPYHRRRSRLRKQSKWLGLAPACDGLTLTGPPLVFSRSKICEKTEAKFVSYVSWIWNRVVLKTKSSRS